MSATTDTAVAKLPAPPSWTQTITFIEIGREFSAGFGDATPDSHPQFPVELVQDEYLDDTADPAVFRRAQPRIYFHGGDCSPDRAAELIALIQAALPHSEPTSRRRSLRLANEPVK